jgi:hypothetical protein
MRAVVLEKFGGLDSLVYKEIPDPEPKAGHVLIEIKAFGINHAEMHMRRGEWAEAAKVIGILQPAAANVQRRLPHLLRQFCVRHAGFPTVRRAAERNPARSGRQAGSRQSRLPYFASRKSAKRITSWRPMTLAERWSSYCEHSDIDPRSLFAASVESFERNPRA